MPETKTATATPATEPKERAYLVAWQASHSRGFSAGASIITLTGPFTQKMLVPVRDHLRKETGHPSADVVSFSRFEE